MLDTCRLYIGSVPSFACAGLQSQESGLLRLSVHPFFPLISGCLHVALQQNDKIIQWHAGQLISDSLLISTT